MTRETVEQRRNAVVSIIAFALTISTISFLGRPFFADTLSDIKGVARNDEQLRVALRVITTFWVVAAVVHLELVRRQLGTLRVQRRQRANGGTPLVSPVLLRAGFWCGLGCSALF